MGVETVSLIVAAFVSGSLAIAALMRNFRSRRCAWFAGMAGSLFFHDALCVIERFQTVIHFSSPRLHMLSILALGPSALYFLKEVAPRRRATLTPLLWIYLPVLAVFLVASFALANAPIAPLLTFTAHLSLLFPASVWLYTLARGAHETPLTRERLRLRFALIGGILTLAFFSTDCLSLMGIAAPPLGTVARTLYLLFLYQTLVQNELMTADEIVARLALFGGVAAILSIIYLLLVSWVGDRSDLFYFNTLIASFVILILFDPIRKLTTRYTRKFFLRRTAALENELNSLSFDLMGTLPDVAELSRRVEQMLKRALGVQFASLYVLDQEGLSFVRVGHDEDEVRNPELSSGAPLVEYMSLRRGRPFVLETIQAESDLFLSAQARRFGKQCQETLRELGADFVIPFFQERGVLGFVAAKTGERMVLSYEQLKLFLPFSRHVGTLLKSARTFTFLRNRDKLAVVGEMAAGLAHEIKNPLGAIKGAAELLKDSIPRTEPGPNEYLDIIVTEVHRLSGVLSEFLDYAKPRRNAPEAVCEPARVIEHTSQLVLKNRSVTFSFKNHAAGLRLRVDPEILKQVLLNLFLNAVQAMGKETETPQLTVHLRELSPQGALGYRQSLVEIEVEDNGPGIRAEDRQRIFVPFFTTKPRGTGLGLAICQRLIEGMGGTISLKHGASQGATFTIHLPAQAESRPTPVAREITLELST